MKHLPKILAFALISLGTGVLVAHAQDYHPLAPLPGTFTGSTGSETTNISAYLSGAIKLLIALGVGLAVLFAIIGGTQYVAASINPSAKKDALERIQHALIGLTIILTSYLLLNSINPKLVDVKFELDTVTITPPKVEGVRVVSQGQGLWADDASVRAQLTPVQINKSNCTVADKNAPGGTNCTSVLNLQSSVIDKIKKLKDSCKCSVIITGGTEYWLHKTHNDNRTVDLSKNSVLDTYITSGAPTSPGGCGVRSAPHYTKDFATYVDEPAVDNQPAHWHVCY